MCGLTRCWGKSSITCTYKCFHLLVFSVFAWIQFNMLFSNVGVFSLRMTACVVVFFPQLVVIFPYDSGVHLE